MQRGANKHGIATRGFVNYIVERRARFLLQHVVFSALPGVRKKKSTGIVDVAGINKYDSKTMSVHLKLVRVELCKYQVKKKYGVLLLLRWRISTVTRVP